MFVRLFALLMLLGAALATQAQTEPLVAENLQLETQLDAFGLESQILSGLLRNTGDDAFADIEIFAELYDADDELIGEGFGFVVNECGVALLDAPLQPDQSQLFQATVDLFMPDAEVERIEIFPEGDVTEPETAPDAEISDAVVRISRQEVVSVEWADDSQGLRYGVGCDGQVFTTYDWYQYDREADESEALDASPNEQFITDAFLQQTGINQITQSRLDNPELFETSYLTFPTQSNRVVYQTDINTVITSEQDGSFKRVVHGVLSRYSLQGFNWSPEGNFVAYYFGAFGEPVRYFTASASQNLISGLLPNNTLSATVPGLVNDARRVIIGGTFAGAGGEEITGYWLSSVITGQRELLFEVDELPGNNYPAPAYYLKDPSTRYIYVVRPIDGQATLQCFYREENELTTLTALPLQLGDDERAWTWLSPDFNTLALGANGVHGGLWLIDLNAFDVCR